MVGLYAQAKDAAGNLSFQFYTTVEGVPEAIAPDLTVSNIVAPDTIAIKKLKRTFRITDTVINTGSAKSGVFKVRYQLYYTSSSPCWWASGSLCPSVTTQTADLTGTRFVYSLKPGESSTGTVTVSVPISTPVKSWQGVRAYADFENVIDELNETNNTKKFVTNITIEE